jgi:hypothetical protein
MSARQWRPVLTPARGRWLRTLAREGVAKRGRGRTGFECMQLRWTTWLYRLPSGSVVTYAEIDQLKKETPEIWTDAVNIGEVLTEEGRRVLRGGS